jgi:hypothetical protein
MVYGSYNYYKSKAIPITDRAGLYGCDMLRIPHCLDNQLTDGGKVFSPMHQQNFTPHTHFFFFFTFPVLTSVRG